MAKTRHSPIKLARDIGAVITSIVVAILLVQTGAIQALLKLSESMNILGSFVAGMFFTSVFTTALATVTLGSIAIANNIWLVALCGGLGAAIGDFLIFKFIRDGVAEDTNALLAHSQRWRAIFHLRFFRFLLPFLGALIIASPLPDEAGLAMMGIVRFKARFLIPLSFIANALGILAIGLVARGLFA